MWAHESRSLSVAIATTKRLLLVSAVLGLVGTVGAANAATINSTSVTIWDGQQSSALITDPSQQALPTATAAYGGPLALIAASTPFAQPINYDVPAGGTNTIPGFFASGGAPTPSTCTGACLTNPLSLFGVNDAEPVAETVFKFTFTVTTATTFTTHNDDGVSLFAAGTETNSCTSTSCPADLLPTSAAGLTGVIGNSVNIGPGTYDLWYEEGNGIPAVLEASCSNSCQATTPLPATLPLFATSLGGLGLLGWRRKRKAQAV